MENNILYPELDDADYKEMYLTMMRASKKAIRILIEAQQTCEELCLNPRKKLQWLNSLGNKHRLVLQPTVQMQAARWSDLSLLPP